MFVLTSDVDWASETAIRISHRHFEEAGHRVTYFLTHPSEYLDGLLASGAIDAGIHPNFLPDSSQGNSFKEVMDYCEKLLPGPGKVFRCHRFFDVNDITEELYARGYRYDSNVPTFLQRGVKPFVHRAGLIRFPVFMEDGTYLYHSQPLTLDQEVERRFSHPGLYVLSFHPMHMVMNSPTLPYSREVKDSVSREAWNAMDEETCNKVCYKGRGIRDFTADLLEMINRRGYKVMRFDDVYEQLKDVIAGGL